MVRDLQNTPDFAKLVDDKKDINQFLSTSFSYLRYSIPVFYN